MKKAIITVLVSSMAALSIHAGTFGQSHASFDDLLKAHVSDGRVDYPALKATPKPLAEYLAIMGQVKEPVFKTWNRDQQLAFLINLYNAATLQLIVDYYPVESIKKIGSFLKGPWDQKVVTLFGDMITLNTLEHEIIRKQYPDPRVHMALVCAARGCPPLRSEAYTGEKLNAQLDDQSRTYLASPSGLVVERDMGEARISAIFKWYGEDFNSVESFVEKYGQHSLRGLNITYIKYDWTLNEKER